MTHGTVIDASAERGQSHRDARHYRHVATTSRRRALDLARRGWEEGAPDRSSCVRTARLAHRTAEKLRAMMRMEGRA